MRIVIRPGQGGYAAPHVRAAHVMRPSLGFTREWGDPRGEWVDYGPALFALSQEATGKRSDPAGRGKAPGDEVKKWK